MNCFVMMPFSSEFDDVYSAIKTSVEAVVLSRGGRCFRLDEARPAGRITDRLLGELQAASFCVADITGNSPNVMWEIGYAMALSKPTILLTQALKELPFDVKDLQSLEYDRAHLHRSLEQPLKDMVMDTLRALGRLPNTPGSEALKERDDLVGALLGEIKDLKTMVSNIVESWDPVRDRFNDWPTDMLAALEGAWVNPDTGSHYYAKVVNEELVVPYSFGEKDNLTGVYFDWRKTGQYWFARFAWLDSEISGFLFLRQDRSDLMTGAWWYDDSVLLTPTSPPQQAGVPHRLQRSTQTEFPTWALDFIEKVRQKGLVSCLAGFRGSNSAWES